MELIMGKRIDRRLCTNIRDEIEQRFALMQGCVVLFSCLHDAAQLAAEQLNGKAPNMLVFIGQ